MNDGAFAFPSSEAAAAVQRPTKVVKKMLDLILAM
jgi:hypothetical protein